MDMRIKGEVMATKMVEPDTVLVRSQAEEAIARTVTIGSQNEFEATLPLSPAEEFLATDQQRSSIARFVLDELLLEDPTNRDLGWGRRGILREEIMRRTGVNDAAASLVLYASRTELDGSTS